MLSLTRRLVAIAVALFMVACQSTPSPSPASDTEVTTTLNFSQVDQDSTFYLSQAKRNQGATANGYRLLAVAALLNEGKAEQASQLYPSLPTTWSESSARSLALLIEAELALIGGDHASALRKLKAVPERELSKGLQLRRARLLGQAYKEAGDPIEAARQLTTVAQATDDSAIRQSLHNSIWELLADVSPFTLVNAATTPAPDVFSGWLRLAALHQEGQKDPQRYLARLTQLQQQYPDHPAFKLPPPPLAMVLTLDSQSPTKIAVLLPLSGRNQPLGEAIRDGITTAYLKGAAGSANLTFIDTTNGMDQALAAVTASGADFIIGPLLRQDLEAMLATPPTIPWLALNRSSGNWPAASLQFALAPEDEAAQTAARMAQDGVRHPLVLVPATTTGGRISATFEEQWLQLAATDHPAIVANYSDRKGIQEAVANALGVGGSQARIRALRQTLGIDLEAEPRSRRDIDAIYLYGTPADARFIKPSIEVALSGSATPPPIYASASAHDLSSGDAELAGALISDMPLLLPLTAEEKELLTTNRTTWPQRGVQEVRLFALGYDALTLVSQFRYLSAFPGYELNGMTGTLHARNGVIHRSVVWAKVTASSEERVAEARP